MVFMLAVKRQMTTFPRDTALRQHSSSARSSIARQQKSRQANLSVVFPHGSKVAIHQLVVLNRTSEMHRSECVQVDGSVRDIPNSQNVRRFGQHGCFT